MLRGRERSIRNRGSCGRRAMAFWVMLEQRMTSGAPVEQMTMSKWLMDLGKSS